MKVTMMLADYAQVADGKLTIVGGGWSITGPMPVPFAIAILFEVPWDRANMKHRFRLDLVDADGHVVFVEGEEGEEPLVVEGEFEAGRPPGLKPGTPLEVPVAINLPGAPVPAGGRYEWRLSVNGEGTADWRLAFSVRDENELPVA
ncbi:MAG: hypothetical protein ICV74_05035 [Thermoleophilia bacterium]|nr:hypothetical protein [Thermoleophilia bacterium]